MFEANEPIAGAVDVAKAVAAALQAAGQEYALGGALGFCSERRGTLDVDVTRFVPPEVPSLAAARLRDKRYRRAEFSQ